MKEVKLGDKISIFEATLETDHPYDVTLEDVIMAEAKVYSRLRL